MGGGTYLVSQLFSDEYLTCKTSVAVRQGRSSRVCSSSGAVPVVTREGSRSTKSSTKAGLSHASSLKREKKNKEAESVQSPRSAEHDRLSGPQRTRLRSRFQP